MKSAQMKVVQIKDANIKNIFDVHAHLVDSAIYSRIVSGKVKLNHKILTSGYSHESNIRTVKLMAAQTDTENLFISLGIAAQEAIKDKDILNPDKLQPWLEFIRSNRPIVTAIGEIGLDYHWTRLKEDIEREKLLFRTMLGIAEELGLPVVVHSRKAEEDTINEMLSYNLKGIILHCFSGSIEQALKAVDNGMLISIPPIKSRQRKEVIKKIGIYNLAVETDMPYIGKRTSDINKSIKIISDTLKIDSNRIKSITYENAVRKLGIRH